VCNSYSIKTKYSQNFVPLRSLRRRPSQVFCQPPSQKLNSLLYFRVGECLPTQTACERVPRFGERVSAIFLGEDQIADWNVVRYGSEVELGNPGRRAKDHGGIEGEGLGAGNDERSNKNTATMMLCSEAGELTCSSGESRAAQVVELPSAAPVADDSVGVDPRFRLHMVAGSPMRARHRFAAEADLLRSSCSSYLCCSTDAEE
jgi:hypothetical protein